MKAGEAIAFTAGVLFAILIFIFAPCAQVKAPVPPLVKGEGYLLSHLYPFGDEQIGRFHLYTFCRDGDRVYIATEPDQGHPSVSVIRNGCVEGEE